MALYRLDYLDGENTEPVRDPVIGGDLLTRHMTTARSRALQISGDVDRPIQISRISGAGQMKVTLVVDPDGHCRRPAKSKPVAREDCTRGTGRPCFCSPCRAERKAAR